MFGCKEYKENEDDRKMDKQQKAYLNCTYTKMKRKT